jgi:hypothetical protein
MPTFVRRQEIEHPIGPTGRLALNATSSDVVFEAVDGATARVEVEFELIASTEADADALFERVRFHARQGDGVLDVSEPKRGDTGIGSIARMLGIGNVKAETSIHVSAPRRADVRYEGVSGDVTAEGFRGQQEYRTVSGDLWLEGLGGSVQVRGVSSDISIRADEPVALEANTVSGDISAFAPRFNDLRVVTVSGDVELEGELAAASDHRVETVSGDLSLGVSGGFTLEVRGLSTEASISIPHRAEGSRDRRRYVIGDGGASMLFSSMSGDVTARPSRRYSEPAAPTPPAPPAAPASPTPPRPPVGDDEQLDILRALEAGEIDVEEASRRLAGGSPNA